MGECVDTLLRRLPVFGDVVEYPLRDIEVEALQDGRIAGVGLLVGRNMDRGDAAKVHPFWLLAEPPDNQCPPTSWRIMRTPPWRQCMGSEAAQRVSRGLQSQSLWTGCRAPEGPSSAYSSKRAPPSAQLPPEQLDLCEIEPLRQEEPGSDRRAHCSALALCHGRRYAISAMQV